MHDLQTHMKNYLEYCHIQKCLDEKTIKASRIDLRQFFQYISLSKDKEITSSLLEKDIGELHQKYKTKTVKRKIASLKAFFRHLEYRETIRQSPFNKMQIRFRELMMLPKTIPLHTVEIFLSTIYKQHRNARTEYQKNALRDAAVTELLFAAGMRISEFCSLKEEDVNLYDGTVLIYGKGDKERLIQIGHKSVIHVLKQYSRC